MVSNLQSKSCTQLLLCFFVTLVGIDMAAAQVALSDPLRPILFDTLDQGQRDSGGSSGSRYYKQGAHERTSYFGFGTGLVIGSGFGNALVDAYSSDYDVGGGMGAVNFGLEIGLKLTRNVYLVPQAQSLFYLVKFKLYIGDIPVQEHYKVGLLFLPGLSGRYIFGSNDKALYARTDLSYPVWTSDLDRLQVEFERPAIGFALGYILSEKTEIEFGYLSAPCKVSAEHDPLVPFPSGPEKANFGGGVLLLRHRVSL